MKMQWNEGKLRPFLRTALYGRELVSFLVNVRLMRPVSVLKYTEYIYRARRMQSGLLHGLIFGFV
jgi:hypothetical protein